MSQHHARVSSRAWETVRLQILNRDGYRCRNCGKPGRLEVDHIEPVSVGGSYFDPDNLQALCRSCHIAKTRLDMLPVEQRAWFEYIGKRQ